MYFSEKTFRLLKVQAILVVAVGTLILSTRPTAAADFDGRYFSGKGDVEYLKLLDTARRMFSPDVEYQNLSMLYYPEWNGLVEGPTWDAWWIQNSYGTTYCALPFLEEPFVTFLQNAQDLWFDLIGDGKRVGMHNWVAPDGCLCDCARPDKVYYKQGDGRIDIHDWGMEFTAAGIVMQGELLLISRQLDAINRYLPKLERSANFIETRRDPINNLFLAGPAGNLLAPSYAGWAKPDGTYGQAYLAGLSITYIAALDRLIELEKLANKPEQVSLYSKRRDAARAGLAAITSDEGYFLRSIDPDGVKHGVFGAQKHGYLETSPNHDAIALRVVDEPQARAIMDKMVSIPQLRPHQFVIPNYPSYDDLYTKPEGLWAFGTWVNGGHWSTCEARMMMAYARLGMTDECRKSMRALMPFAEKFRMDNPLTKFGSEVYQPNEKVNLCYDSFGPPAALIRGLFEYVYASDGLTIYPHIPSGITELHQKIPIRFGSQRLYISTAGKGPVTAVKVHGRDWYQFTTTSIFLAPEANERMRTLEIGLGGTAPPRATDVSQDSHVIVFADSASTPTEIVKQAARLHKFFDALTTSGAETNYELAHAGLAADAQWIAIERIKSDRSKSLPEASREAADKMYTDAATKLFSGFEAVMKKCAESTDPEKKRLAELWTNAAQ